MNRKIRLSPTPLFAEFSDSSAEPDANILTCHALSMAVFFRLHFAYRIQWGSPEKAYGEGVHLLAMLPPINVWSVYRKRRNLVLSAAVACVSSIFVQWILPSSAIVASVACVCFALLVFGGLRFLRFPCPKCGKHFFMKWWYLSWNHVLWTRRCVHCGLPKYSNFDFGSTELISRIQNAPGASKRDGVAL